MRHLTVLTLAVMGLAGCALNTAPGYRVASANETGIKLLSDPSLLTTGQLDPVAAAHCAQFGRKAVEQNVGKQSWGRVPVTYACQ